MHLCKNVRKMKTKSEQKRIPELGKMSGFFHERKHERVLRFLR